MKGSWNFELKIKFDHEREEPGIPSLGQNSLGAAFEGLTYERVDHHGETIAKGFDPVGLLAKTRPEPPTYAGVLAYTSAAKISRRFYALIDLQEVVL